MFLAFLWLGLFLGHELNTRIECEYISERRTESSVSELSNAHAIIFYVSLDFLRDFGVDASYMTRSNTLGSLSHVTFDIIAVLSSLFDGICGHSEAIPLGIKDIEMTVVVIWSEKQAA